MKIYEAYDNPSIRIHFKKYIEAEGVSLTRREQIYTRFGTYISRIRGVRFDRMLLDASGEEDFRDKLSHIFHIKWKDHIGYPEIPGYFFRYLDFLHTFGALNPDLIVEGLLADDESEYADGNLTRYEEPFMTNDGKLRLLANPTLINHLRSKGVLRLPASDEAARLCAYYYSGTALSMSDDDWKALLDDTLKPKTKTRKRGDISFELIDDNGQRRICNSYQAMESIVSLVGIDKVLRCNLRLNGQPIITKSVPKGKTGTFKDIGNGFFLNNMGTPMDRFKVMRALISLYRLPWDINLSKDDAVKSARKPQSNTGSCRQPESGKAGQLLHVAIDESQSTDSANQLQPSQSPDLPPASNLKYDADGMRSLFDDF